MPKAVSKGPKTKGLDTESILDKLYRMDGKDSEQEPHEEENEEEDESDDEQDIHSLSDDSYADPLYDYNKDKSQTTDSDFEIQVMYTVHLDCTLLYCSGGENP